MSTPTSPLGSHDLNDVVGRDLDDTIAALEGGLTTVSIDSALRIVRLWEETLRGSDRAELHPLAELLSELHDALSVDRLDGPAIGDLLVQLGEGTTAAAADAMDDRVGPTLERLGTILTAAGTSLAP
jgi:hypothetical protein